MMPLGSFSEEVYRPPTQFSWRRAAGCPSDRVTAVAPSTSPWWALWGELVGPGIKRQRVYENRLAILWKIRGINVCAPFCWSEGARRQKKKRKETQNLRRHWFTWGPLPVSSLTLSHRMGGFVFRWLQSLTDVIRVPFPWKLSEVGKEQGFSVIPANIHLKPNPRRKVIRFNGPRTFEWKCMGFDLLNLIRPIL